ncbi:hypothetical protein ACIOKD_20520 [Streptomyces sp. NPDC087844]|uniref:hypothetical protein n=1 Tax=Streptomyces sp. NPDC087844 TaxID=3365805 RepID=UPI00381A696F
MRRRTAVPPNRRTPEAAVRADACQQSSPGITYDIRPHGAIVRLTVAHEDLAAETAVKQVSLGWPAVLADLQSLLETGKPLPREPWLVPEH